MYKWKMVREGESQITVAEKILQHMHERTRFRVRTCVRKWRPTLMGLLVFA